MNFGGHSPPNPRRITLSNNESTNQVEQNTTPTNEQGTSEMSSKPNKKIQSETVSLKNSRNVKIDQQDPSNIQSGSKMPTPIVSLKNSQNINLPGKLSSNPEIPILSPHNPPKNFQSKHYVNYARGSRSINQNCIGIDDSSDLFDANYLNPGNMGTLSSTRRKTIMEDELLKSAEFYEDRLKAQNERHQLEKQRFLASKNQQLQLFNEQKVMIENLQKLSETLQNELIYERSRDDKNNSSSTTNELSALMTNLLNKTNNTSSSSTKILGADERRPKILESIKKNPIDKWQFGVSGNLYVFLRFKAESYLKSMSLTRAETAQAISNIFSQSHYAEDTAMKICMENLADHPQKENRILTYRALARQLDENGGITIEPLNSEERVIDLFLRCKLILECELDGQVETNSEAEEKLNHRAIKKMLNQNENLMPEEDQEKIAALWNSIQVMTSTSMKARIKTEQAISLFNNYDSMRVLRMQNNVGERKKQVQDLANKRENAWSNKDNSWSKTKKGCEICYNHQHATKDCPLLIYGPCEKCLQAGIPRQRIKHTTRHHKFNQKPNEGLKAILPSEGHNNPQSQTNKFGPPPPSLQKYNQNNNLNLMTKGEIQIMKNNREITVNEEGYLCVRLEVGSSITDIMLDTGCTFEGVIESSMVKDLNLEKYMVKNPTTISFADGTKTTYETRLELPMRFKETADTLQIVVMDNLPAKFILGTPGIQKLGIKLDIFDQKN